MLMSAVEAEPFIFFRTARSWPALAELFSVYWAVEVSDSLKRLAIF